MGRLIWVRLPWLKYRRREKGFKGHWLIAAGIETLLDLPSPFAQIILLRTIANTIPLNDYNPKWDFFWKQVAAEIPGRLPQQCRERCMPAAFLAQMTSGFLRISVVPCAPANSLLCVSNDSRNSSCKTAPSPSLMVLAHTCTQVHWLSKHPPASG